jgi:hypothetical protein
MGFVKEQSRENVKERWGVFEWCGSFMTGSFMKQCRKSSRGKGYRQFERGSPVLT